MEHKPKVHIVCLLVIAIDASRLTKGPAKIKGVLEVIFKNGSQPGEAAAAAGGASNEAARTPCPPDTLGPRFPQAMCLVLYPAENVIALLEGHG